MSTNITKAWKVAERTCFTKLVKHMNAKENVDAFLGFNAADRESWMFTSGGLAVGPVARYQGPSPAWCNFSINARIEGVYSVREPCLDLAGAVLGFLKGTTNLNQIGNVQNLAIADFPGEPVAEPQESGIMIWRVIIPLRLTFATEVEYDA